MVMQDDRPLSENAQTLIDAFINWLDVQKGAAVATQRAYRTDLVLFGQYLQQQNLDLGRPCELSARNCEGWLAWMFRNGIAKSSMSRKLAALRRFFRHLQLQGHTDINVAANIRNPRQEKRKPAFLNVDEAFALLDTKPAKSCRHDAWEAGAADARDLALVELLYGSGLRISEALSLDLENIALDDGIARVMGKGARERLAPLTDTAMHALSNWLAFRGKIAASGQKALFLGIRGGRLNRREAARIIVRLCENAGINHHISPHGLRHSFATHMLGAGADLRGLQELLGHKRVSTTQHYTHLGIDKLVHIYDASHPRAGDQGKQASEP